jgi:endonuclease III
MGKCFKVDLQIENGYTLLIVFDAMKKLQQETSLIDESVTISYNDKIKITAGIYDSFEELDDLFMSIICCDKELIKNHVREILSKHQDPEVLKSAIDNICESMEHMNHKYSSEEKEELIKLAGLKKGKAKRITKNMIK